MSEAGDTYQRLWEAEKQRTAALNRQVNELYRQIAARDAFVRWFAAEYGLQTYGRSPSEMVPARLTGVARWSGWFARMMGRTVA